MTSLGNKLRHGLGRTAKGVASRPLVHALTVGAVAVALLLLGVVVLVSDNVSQLAGRWGGGVQMVVYLEPDTTPEHARTLGGILLASPAVRDVDYVPPDEAQRRLSAALGEHTDVMAGIETGYLPASLEVQLADGVKEVITLSPLLARLKAARGVESVELMGDWVERVSSLLGTLRAATLALGFLVAGACIYIVMSTIQLGMLARKEELEILELVGATSRFVRAPLFLEGAVAGASGALVAVGLLYGLYSWAAPAAQRVLSDFMGPFEMHFLSPAQMAGTVLAGAALGLVASWLAVGHRARG